jgi:hypothetical protein
VIRAYRVAKVFRRECQQISAHPRDRNASWMSARLSYRTRRQPLFLTIETSPLHSLTVRTTRKLHACDCSKQSDPKANHNSTEYLPTIS